MPELTRTGRRATPPAIDQTPATKTPHKPTRRRRSPAGAAQAQNTTPATFERRRGKASKPTSKAKPGAGALALQLAELRRNPKAVAALVAKYEKPADLAAAGAVLEQALTALAGHPLTPRVMARLEKQVIGLLVELAAAGKLEAALQPVAFAALAKLQPHASDAEKAVMVGQFAKMIEHQLGAHGLTPATQGNRYLGWEELGARHLAQANAESARIDTPAFAEQLARVLGVPFVPAEVELLVDGPPSFALRDRWIDQAEHSIHLMTWAFYDDATGNQTLEKLKAALARGVEVRVLVDDEVANEPSHASIVAKLEAAGIPVARVPGHHRKVMVVDGKVAIIGGINIGDVYSHRGAAATDAKQRWRDTDIAVYGAEAVAQAHAVIQAQWDALAARLGLPPMTRPEFVGAAGTDNRVAVVDDAPGERDRDPIFVGLLKAIVSCREPSDGPIDIENAYFILNPALRQALLEARARGVQVRILSNSPESVDVPIISAPIVESLAEMAAAGCEVYLKSGATLHSKLAAVGKSFATVGSYNLHPQSVKLKGETNAFVLGERFTGELRQQFERDLAAARRLDPASIPPAEPNPLGYLVKRFFYDFL